jgi:hypothetical protein
MWPKAKKFLKTSGLVLLVAFGINLLFAGALAKPLAGHTIHNRICDRSALATAGSNRAAFWGAAMAMAMA